MPTQEYLKNLHTYNPDTGEYLSHRFKKPLGSKDKRGRIRAKIQGKPYFVSRLVWVWMTGEDPGDNYVDHIDGNPSNNKWSNLRLTTPAQNSHNRILPSNLSGYRGVYKLSKPCGKRYYSQVVSNGVKHYLGVFDTPEEAHAAYIQKIAELHGEYAYTLRND